MRKLLIATLLAAVAGPSAASGEDELTSLSYISYLERYATVQPATQQDSVEAVINMPLVPGDRIDTAREARMEVILADANVLWIDEYTTLSLDAVAFSRDDRADQTVLFLGEGTIMVEISDHRLSDQPLRIDGPSATVYLSDIGLYRALALPSGGLRLEVWEGIAEAATIAGGVLVRAQSATELSGGEVIGSEAQLTWGDDFSSWVEQRRLVVQGESTTYVDARYGRQASQLDNYGNWVFLSEYNTWAWQPVVSASWRPYTAGRWYWTPTGWSWVSYEPWGWLPYHYGSWYFSVGFGWVWSWHPYWSPAWVSWSWWPGYVGWCPYGYYWGWYWPRYSHYYGYPYWPYPGHPSYPGGGGGGQQPPRRAAIPRPGDGGSEASGGGRTAIPRPNEIALDLKGRVRVAEMDRTGWNVVSTRDFASPHLSRLVQPGETALRGRNDVGVVVSDPLTTAPPSTARPPEELERVFRGYERSVSRDITPIVARDSGLRGEDALRLVEPTTVREISRRSAAAAAEAPSHVVRERPTGAVLTTSPDSPLYRSGARSGVTSYGSTSGSSARTPVDRQAAAPNPFVPRSRPSSAAAAPSRGSLSSGGEGYGALRPSPLTPGTSYRTPTSRVIPPSGRSVTSPGPVVIPRSPGPSSGVRSVPSAPRRSTTSSPRSSSSTIRSSPSGRSSSMRAPSVSRPSGGVSAAPRSAPSSTARSSGGARRR